jgi:hypothetical protein
MSLWSVFSTRPPEVLVYTKMCERRRARTEGKDPPEYTRVEIEEMRRQDLETVSGIGAEAFLRGSIGWQTPEAQHMLDVWEGDVRRRLAEAEGLPPERWGEVWGVDEE